MLLPGPPKEMEPMFLSMVMQKLHEKLENRDRMNCLKVLRFYGIGEAELETEIEDLLENQTNPTIAPLAADGEVTLRLPQKMNQERNVKHCILEVEAEIIASCWSVLLWQ